MRFAVGGNVLEAPADLIHARKLMDDLDEQFEASDGDDTQGWGQLLTFLCASALFVVVVLTWKSGS